MTEDKRLKQLRELGLTISYYRKLKGLTQGQLASLVGLSRTHISNIEAPNIKTSISLDSLLDIAEALGISVKDRDKLFPRYAVIGAKISVSVSFHYVLIRAPRYGVGIPCVLRNVKI